MKMYIWIIPCLLLGACSRKLEVTVPSLNVTTASTVYKVGDTVQFVIDGSPDIISFYSGEIGNDFEHRNGRILSSRLVLSFQTEILDGAQPDQLSVLASNDLDTPYTFSNVHAANWKDITKNFRLATHEDDRSFVDAGQMDIAGLLAEGSPLYIGFRYVCKPQSQYGRYNIWKVQDFLVQAINEAATTAAFDQGTAGWSLVLGPNNEPNRSRIRSNYVDLRGNRTNIDIYTEAWAITQPMYLSKESDFGPDRGTGIKDLSDPPLESYPYIYTKPGTYTATFVASNATADGSKQAIKQITLTINP